MFNLEWADPRATTDHIGYLPMIFSDVDPRPCVEQVNANYAHGGGWNAFKGFTAKGDLYNGAPATISITYPGDPSFRPIFTFFINKERVILFSNSWVMIVQPDGSHEISRMD